MSLEQDLLEETAEDLFENAPCGYLSTRLDGTIVKVNRTFETWTGLRRGDLVDARRFQELLSPGGQIYYETHYAPLLEMQGAVREIAVEVVRADGSRLPALVNSVLQRDAEGRPRLIRTTVFDATDRRAYEQELLAARRREHDIARQLQRSLLSGDLPRDPRVDIGVAYRPGVSDLEVGGDWYDAFWLDERETLGLVVGDVVGRGIAAAATMGQLRSATRALATISGAPGMVLEALDAYADRHGIGQMATLVYATLELATGAVRFACAGHLPPLILGGEDDGSRFSWDGRSLPLGAQVAGARAEGACTLGAGDAILLYTDGLVERRTRSLDDGLEQLRSEARQRRGEPAGALAESVARDLADPDHEDDVCVLVARVSA